MMPKSHQFRVDPVGWPTDTAANRAMIKVTEPNGVQHFLVLNAGELRSLARTALMGLGYTKVVRPFHGKQAGWENRILARVTPAMTMIEGFFPKSTSRSTAGAQR